MILWDTFIESAEQSLAEGALSKAEELYLSALEEVDSDGCTDLRAVQTLQGLCEVYFRQGRQGYAKPYLERLSRLLDGLSGAEPEKRLLALQAFASLHEFSGDMARAEGTWRLILKGLDVAPDSLPEVRADVSRKLAMSLLKNGQESEAAPLLEVYWRILPEGPDALTVLQVLAGIAVRKGRWVEADEYLEPLCRLLPSDEASLSQWRTHRARSLASQGKHAEAVEVYESLLIHHHEWTEDQVDLVVRAARAAFEIGKVEVGERLAKSVLASGLKIESSQRFALLLDMQRLALQNQDETAAHDYLRDAIGLYEEEGEMVTELVGPEVLVQCYWVLGESEQRAHNWEEAMRLYSVALQLHLTSEDPSPAETVAKVGVLADLQVALERWDEAERALRLGIQGIEKSGLSQTPQAATLFALMGAVYRGKNRLAQGEQLVKKALALLETHFGADSEQLLTALNELSKIQKGQGDKQNYKLTRQRMAAIKGEEYIDEVTPGERLEEADALLASGDTPAAEALLLELQQALEARDGPEIIPTYRRLAALHEERSEWDGAVNVHRKAVAWLQKKGDAAEWVEQSFLLSSALSQQGSYEEAEILLSQLVGVASKLGMSESAAMGRYKALMGEVYRFGGKDRLAEPSLIQAVGLLSQHQGATHPDLLEARRNLALLYRDQGAFVKAQEQLNLILSAEEKTFGSNHPDLAVTLSQLGELSTATGDYPRAEALFRQALELSQKGLGSDHPNVAATHNNLAQILLNEGRHAEAREHLERALALFNTIPGHPGVVHATANLGVISLHQGDLDEAQKLLTQSLQWAEEHFGQNDLEVAFCGYQLAEVYLRKGQFQQASDVGNRALALRSQTLGREHPETAASLLQCALIYSKMGQPQRALDKALLGLRIQTSVLGPEHPELASAVAMLGEIYFDLKLYQESATSFERAIAMLENSSSAGGGELVRLLLRNAEVREQQGKGPDAVAGLRRALELQSQTFGEDHDEALTLLRSLARLHQSLGQWKEAEAALRKVLAVITKRAGGNEVAVSLALSSLAALYGAQGKATVAESLYKKAADTVANLSTREPLENILGQWERFLESHGRENEVIAVYERYEPGAQIAPAPVSAPRQPLVAPVAPAVVEPPASEPAPAVAQAPRKVVAPVAAPGPLPRPSAPLPPKVEPGSIEIPELPPLKEKALEPVAAREPEPAMSGDEPLIAESLFAGEGTPALAAVEEKAPEVEPEPVVESAPAVETVAEPEAPPEPAVSVAEAEPVIPEPVVPAAEPAPVVEAAPAVAPVAEPEPVPAVEPAPVVAENAPVVSEVDEIVAPAPSEAEPTPVEPKVEAAPEPTRVEELVHIAADAPVDVTALPEGEGSLESLPSEELHVAPPVESSFEEGFPGQGERSMEMPAIDLSLEMLPAVALEPEPEPTPPAPPAPAGPTVADFAALIDAWSEAASPPAPAELKACGDGLRELERSITQSESQEKLAAIYVRLGEIDAAQLLMNDALATREAIDGREAPTTVEAYVRLAEMLSRSGRHEQSESLWLRVIDLRARSMGGDDPRVADALAALGHTYVHLRNAQASPLLNRALQIYRRKTPDNFEVLSRTVTALGLLAEAQSKRPDAITHYREALQLRKLWAQKADRTPDAEDADLYVRLASLGLAEKDLEVALQAWREARTLAQSEGAKEEVASLAQRLGPALLEAGREEDASAVLQVALQAQRGDGPLGTDNAPVLSALLKTARTNSQWEDVVKVGEELLGIQEASFGPNSPVLMGLLYDLGEAYLKLGRASEAQIFLERSLVLQEVAEDSRLGSTLFLLAVLAAQAGDIRRAEDLIQRGIGLEATDGQAVATLVVTLEKIGAEELSSGLGVHAEGKFRTALVLRDQLGVSDPGGVAATSQGLGRALNLQGRWEEAESVLRKSFELRSQLLGSESPVTIDTLFDLAECYRGQRKFDAAESFLTRVAELRKRLVGPTDISVGQSYRALGQLKIDSQNFAVAEEHLSKAFEIFTTAGASPLELASVTELLGLVRSQQGRPAEALEFYRQALSAMETHLGSEHPRTADVLARLTTTLEAAGLYAEAEPLARRTLESRIRSLGPNHRDVSASRIVLANCLSRQDKIEEARELYEQALAGLWAELGEDHTDVAACLEGLGSLETRLGRWEEAESRLQRALTIREKVSGATHPSVAESLNNLAALYEESRRYELAEKSYKRVLEIRTRALGADHPLVAESLEALGRLYTIQGRYVPAEALFERALELKERVQGKDHRERASALMGLAKIYLLQNQLSQADATTTSARRLLESGKDEGTLEMADVLHLQGEIARTSGRFSEARGFFEKSLTIRHKLLGPNHMMVGLSLLGLGLLSQELGQYEICERFLTRAVQIFESVVGPEHPHVADALHALGILYRSTGRGANSELFLKRSMEIRTKSLGNEHPDLSTSLLALAQLYLDQRNDVAAEALLKRALEIREKVLRADHPALASIQLILARMFKSQEKYVEAEPLFKRVMDQRDRVYGAQHPETANIMRELAELYQLRGQRAQAETLHRRALDILERRLGTQHPSLLPSLYLMLDLYRSASLQSEVDKIQQRIGLIEAARG